jgi:hypothetical protein
MVPATREQQGHPARFDAKQQQRSSDNLGGHGQVGEEPGHAERLEILHRADGREHLDLEPGMGEEHQGERNANPGNV